MRAKPTGRGARGRPSRTSREPFWSTQMPLEECRKFLHTDGRRELGSEDHEGVDGDAAVRAADKWVRVERFEVVTEVVCEPR